VASYYITTNDAGVQMTATLTDARGQAIDLSDADSVTFHLGTEGDPANSIIEGACTIVTPASGIVRYTFTAANTALLEGGQTYDAEFEINWAGTVIRTVPSKAGGFKVVVKGEVG